MISQLRVRTFGKTKKTDFCHTSDTVIEEIVPILTEKYFKRKKESILEMFVKFIVSNIQVCMFNGVLLTFRITKSTF